MLSQKWKWRCLQWNGQLSSKFSTQNQNSTYDYVLYHLNDVGFVFTRHLLGLQNINFFSQKQDYEELMLNPFLYKRLYSDFLELIDLFSMIWNIPTALLIQRTVSSFLINKTFYLSPLTYHIFLDQSSYYLFNLFSKRETLIWRSKKTPC